MGVYIDKIDLVRLSKIRVAPIRSVLDVLQGFNLIEIDDDVWENEKYKLIRMTQAVRINKEMAERRADDNTIKADK